MGRFTLHAKLVLMPLVVGLCLCADCPSGWRAYKDYCYLFHSVTSTLQGQSWQNARLSCQLYGADLADVRDKNESDFIYKSQTTREKYQHFWLGISDRAIEGVYQFIDGSNATYFNWNKGEPNNYGGNEDCIETHFDGTFNDNSCDRAFGYICKKKKGAPTPTPRTAPPLPTGTTQTTCDAGWTGFNNSCYFLVRNRQSTFQEARQDCKDRGGDLAQPKTKSQQAFLTNAVKNTYRDYWIGLTDTFKEGTFYWVDKTPLDNSTSNWAPREPSNDFGGEDCVQMYSRYALGKWNDNHCTAKLPYICEKTAGQSMCPEGWITNGEYCYQLNVHPAQKMSWLAARQSCMSYSGGDLASINDVQEQAMLIKAVKSYGTLYGYFWIGLNDNRTEGTFEWSDGTAVKYTNWGNGQPTDSRYGKYDCVSVLIGYQYRKSDSYWVVSSCTSYKYFVCKRKREYGRCHNPLGMENFNIGNDKITASSQKSPTTPPYAARWNHVAALGLDGAWCAASNDRSPYLQIDLGEEFTVRYIGLQGKANAQAFVTRFYLMYSNDGSRWSNFGYNPPTQYLSLMGNSYYNKARGVAVGLNPTINTRYVRLVPIQFQGGACMRAEIYGCKADLTSACGKNWIQGYKSGVCYRVSTYRFTWAAARADCLSSGGDLLSINSNAEKAFVLSKLKDYKDRFDNFWIGLNDRDNTKLYRWSDGSPVTLVNWGSGKPQDRTDRLDCIGITSASGYWFDDNCYTKRPYICKRQTLPRSLKKAAFNSNWLSTTDHYWPLQEVTDGQVIGTRSGKATGNFKSDSAFMNRKHLVFDRTTTSLQFNGFAQTCVSVPQQCMQGLSVSFLINLPKLPNTKGYILDILGQQSKDAVGWSVYVQSSKLGVLLRSKHRVYTGLVTVNAGQWINAGFTWSFTDGLRVYIDGVAKVRSTYGTRPASPMSNEEVTSLFVAMPATSKTANISMEMMSLAIWERLLNANEMMEVFKGEMRKCAPGWIMFGQYCYSFETTKRTWTDANLYCQSQQGQLVSISSGVEQAFITVGVGSSGIAKNAWIGLNSKQLDHIYNWTDGSRVIYTNWANGEPNNMFGYRREDCGETWQTGLWNDEICTVRKPQICKKEKEVLPTTPNDKGFQRDLVIREYSVSPITCPLGTFITIKSAIYGKASNACKKDVKSIIEKGCADSQKFYCLVKSSNDVFGDPCPTIVKELNITYTCTPDNSFFQDYTIGCPAGWSLRPGKTSCYKLFMQEKSWMDARKFCQNSASGADLVSIGSRTEQVFVTTLLVNAYVSPHIWNGFSDRSSPGQYKWSDNSSVTYSNWYNGQPDEDTRRQSCVKMNLKEGVGDVLFWTDDDCDDKHAFMCEVPKKATTRTPPVVTSKPTGTCAMGWTRIKNSCFKVNVKRANWLDARDNCVRNGSRLASILDRDENEGVFNLLSSGPQNVSVQEAWIGLTDKGIFRGQFWVDGSPVSFTLWDSMEPNSYLNMKACAVMASNGNWRDAECSFQRPYVCKASLKGGATSKPTTAPPLTPSQDPKICPPGWRWWYGNGLCYFFKNTTVQVDWYTARQSCVRAGGDLISINNKEEQKFVASFVPSFPSGRVWIGLSDLSTEGGFAWSDGSPAAFLNFEQGQPDDWHGMEDCVEIRNYGFWNDAMCSRKFSYACKRHNNSAPVASTVPPTAGPVTGYCDPGWVHYRNKCYKYMYGKGVQRTWMAARDYCRGTISVGRKSDLVSIHSSYENAFVNSRSYDALESLWIGLSDIQIEKTFGWSDQSVVTYTNWNYRQPDDFARKEDCVELAPYYRIHGKWNDLDCSSSRGFVCQTDAVQTKPTGKPPTTSTMCPANYVEYAGNCYSFKSKPASWDVARESCRKENAKSELVSIHSHFEQDHVFSYYAEFARNIWTGFHRLPNNTKYRWSDNTPSDYTYWQGAVGALPNDVKGCVYSNYASHSDGRWMKSTCDKKFPYVCKMTKADPEHIPDYPGTCPIGWKKKNKHCYIVKSSYYHRVEWAAARQKCLSMGAQLASIHSKEEQEFIYSQIRDQYRSVWIGLNDRARENGFVWSDGSSFDFTYWGPKEPNDNGGIENCVEIPPLTGRWNDLKCSQLLGYVCKKNLECSSPLGMENKTITDDMISASSFYGQHFPQAGRLNSKGVTQGWCTNQTNGQQFLQIDTGMTTRLTRIAMQGVTLNGKPNYALSYRLYYSEDNVDWKPYKVMGKEAVLIRKGNTVATDNIALKDAQAGRYFRINPVTWKGEFICMMVEIYGCPYVCESPLGMESKVLKDSMITASSANPKFKASDGRLNIPGARAWCAVSDVENQWLQIDLAGVMQIGKIATQGLMTEDAKEHVVTAYKLSYSDDGKKWTDYKALNGEIRIFSGNNFARSAVFHRFSSAVTGRFIRFYPLSWKGHICMRVEVYGCPLACNQPLGLESGKLPNSALSASSTLSSSHAPSMGRLNMGGSGKGAWCAARDDRNQYLEIDMGSDARIIAVATQGFDSDISKYVTDYILQYSMDGKFWNTYAVNGKIEILQGNNNGYSPNKVELKASLHGRYIRFNPQHWTQGICMRIELYGCALSVVPTEEPPPQKKVIQATIRLTKAEWTSDLTDRTSAKYKALANKVETGVTQLYLDDYAFKDGFQSVTVTGFRRGSIIVDFVVIFRSDDSKITDPLKKSVESGKVGDLVVDQDYLTLKVEGSTGKQTGKEESTGLSRGGKIALVVFFILLIVIILVSGALWYWKKRRETNQFAPKSFDNPVHYDARTYNVNEDGSG